MVEIKSQRVNGKIEIPASKSQTIRAFLLATFAQDESIIRHALISEDTKACIEACKALGAKIEFNSDYSLAYVDSRNLYLDKPEIQIDCLNSGTTLYLLLGLAASLGIAVTLFGDKQLNARPVGPLVKALGDLGADISSNNGYPPITIKGPLKGGKTTIECKTSQYLSSLLLASPLSDGNCEINCSLLYEKPYVDLTLGWLREEGINIDITEDKMHTLCNGGQIYKGFDSYIDGDFSSASFFFCMAAMSKSSVTVKGLNPEDPQGDKEILNILKKMGCNINWNGNEVTVSANTPLKGGEFDLNAIPDTLPILAVTASFATEDVHLTNVPQARIKETDRIAAMCYNLRKLGIDVEEEKDGILIHAKGHVSGGEVKGFGDHRIIMALASIAAGTEKSIYIDDISAMNVTFPSFFDLYNSIRRN